MRSPKEAIGFKSSVRVASGSRGGLPDRFASSLSKRPLRFGTLGTLAPLCAGRRLDDERGITEFRCPWYTR